MHNYLLLKTAERLIVPSSIKGKLQGDAVAGISTLADKANMPTHKAIPITLYSQDDTISDDLKKNTGGINRGSRIAINDGVLSPLFDHDVSIVNPLTVLHEYGHTFDNATSKKQFRGFLQKFMPQTAYRLFRDDYEKGADDNARKIIDAIENEEERKLVRHAYDRYAAFNEMINKVHRPAHLGYAIGSISGGATGALGGGYLGYKGMDKLYRYLDKNTNKEGYTPTFSHRLTNYLGAATGGIAGANLGSNLGSRLGEAIGSNFIDKKKVEKAKNLYKRHYSQMGLRSMLDSAKILRQYA